MSTGNPTFPAPGHNEDEAKRKEELIADYEATGRLYIENLAELREAQRKATEIQTQLEATERQNHALFQQLSNLMRDYGLRIGSQWVSGPGNEEELQKQIAAARKGESIV